MKWNMKWNNDRHAFLHVCVRHLLQLPHEPWRRPAKCQLALGVPRHSRCDMRSHILIILIIMILVLVMLLPLRILRMRRCFFCVQVQHAKCKWQIAADWLIDHWSPLIVSLRLRRPFHCQAAWVKAVMDILGSQFQCNPGLDAAPLKYGSDCSGIDSPWWSLRMLQSAINAPWLH